MKSAESVLAGIPLIQLKADELVTYLAGICCIQPHPLLISYADDTKDADIAVTCETQGLNFARIIMKGSSNGV